jgi:hypothetical protein
MKEISGIESKSLLHGVPVLSKNNKYLFLAEANTGSFKIFDIKKMKELTNVNLHFKQITCL